MLERIVENWLDSASERSYQNVFCQMLIAQGYTILHNTRHSPLEMGKDVIARDPQGQLVAYQLKGNPGNRLTLRQYRDIQNQIIQLVTQPVSHPNVQNEVHHSYLVTNGEIDEEAQLAIAQQTEGFRQSGYTEPDVRTISRGQMLTWANELGQSLWPSELSDINTLLELLIYDGKDFFPIDKADSLFKNLLNLSNSDDITNPEIIRRISSCAILTGIILKNFYKEENHFAIFSCWLLYYSYVISTTEKHNLTGRIIDETLDISKSEAIGSLIDLAKEVISRDHLVEGNAMADTLFYSARTTLLTGLLSVLWFHIEASGNILNELKIEIEKFIKMPPNNHMNLWGEGAVPQWLAYYWYIRRKSATMVPDVLLGQLLSKIVNRNSSNIEDDFFPTPYYSIEDIVGHQLFILNGSKGVDPLKDGNPGLASYMSEGLLHLLCRSLHKQTCKAIWPNFTRLGHTSFLPGSKWEYCLWRSESGREVMVQPELTKTWDQLCYEARDATGAGIPDRFLNDPIMLLLFLIVFPHRATPSAIRYLGYKLNKCWFIQPPITN